MPSLAVYSKDLAPWVPAIDARRLDKPGIISGQNFQFLIDGPTSSFTSNFANWWPFDSDTNANIQNFRVNGVWFYCTPTGIWAIDPVSFLPTLLYGVTIEKPFLPWSHAQVGNLHYFAQYNIPLIQYNATTNAFATVATSEDVRFICLSYGRLVCLGSDTVFWSALDDGTDFTPSLTTGAGFQPLSILSKTAFRCDPVSDGVIISTDLGWIKGEFVQANFVFRWYVVSDAVRLFSSNAGVVVPDLGIIQLDATGFHVSDGTKPKAWQPEMAAYLQTAYLNSMDKSRSGFLRLSYVTSLNILFVSVAGNTREGSYQIAFAYSLVTGKWGVMNTPHHGIIELDVSLLLFTVSGFMDLQGYMRYFTDANFTQSTPIDGVLLEDVAWRLSSEPTMSVIEDVYTGTTELISLVEDPDLFNSLIVSGLFRLNEDNIIEGYNPTQISPNSYVELGPFRFAEQQEADETSAISTLLVGTSAGASGTILVEDWDVDEGDEDWSDTSSADVFEDWGLDVRNPDVFDLDLIATDDGVNMQIQGAERLDPIENPGAHFQYSPDGGYSAIFHKIKISATEPGQAFGVKYVNIAGHLTGRHI